MKKDITIYLIARLNSERLPNKMIIPFNEINGMCLFEHACINLKNLKYKLKAAIGEQPLIDMAKRNNVEIEFRPQNELDSNGELREVFNFLTKADTSHAMLISPCNPFITAEVINDACDKFLANDYESMTSVVKEQNWYFDENQKPLFKINPYRMNSKDLKLFSLANVFEVFSVKRFIEEGIYYTFENVKDPAFFELNKNVAIDIDDQIDFDIAQSILKNSLEK